MNVSASVLINDLFFYGVRREMARKAYYRYQSRRRTMVEHKNLFPPSQDAFDLSSSYSSSVRLVGKQSRGLYNFSYVISYRYQKYQLN